MPEPKKTKIIKKNWYQITASNVLKNAFLGESYLPEPSAMIGRSIMVNLMQITNNSKNQNINLRLLINAVEDNKGLADVIGYEIMPSTIRRLLRKEKKKLELSFVCETADKVKLRMKPLAIINKNTKGSTKKALRKQTQDFLKKTIQKMNYNDIVMDMINYKLQDSLRNHLKRIYPLNKYEIREMHIINP